MKGTTGFFVYALLILVAAIFSGDILTVVFGEGRSFWTVFLSLAGISAAAVAGWFAYNRNRLQLEDKEYVTALVVKKEVMGDASTTDRPAGGYNQQLTAKEKEKKPSFLFQKKWLGVAFWIGILCIYGSCSYGLGQIETENEVQATVWNADNIPLPHLTDGMQYVSNPDTLLSQAAVDSINVICQQLDRRLGVESAVIIVRHVENEDAFRVALDIGNKYGVGKKETDRGLVVVVAYDDRRYFIAPGRGLEADLTDAECNHLAVDYLKPYMRANDPDNAMKKLMGATLMLLEGKEMPDVDEDPESLPEPDDPEGDLLLWVMALLFGWIGLFYILNGEYQWANTASGTGYTGYGRDRSRTGSSWGSGWGGFSGGFGGGGGSFGGGYGGGSFGGGGAGGGW